MNPDRYTKVVLTIIAAALVWLCVRDLVPTVQARASANQESVRLSGVDVREPLPVKIVGIERGRWLQKINAFDSAQQFQPWETIAVVTR